VSPPEYARERGLNHLRWCGRYSFGGFACLFGAGFAAPQSLGRAGFALAVGYGLFALAARERRRARGLLL